MYCKCFIEIGYYFQGRVRLGTHKSIVGLLPCFNVEKQCRDVIEKSLQFCDCLILVNDGSKDDTLGVLTDLSEKHSNINILNFEKNQGKGTALIKGIQYALDHFQFDVLVTLDSDGQHDPSYIKMIVDPIFHGADMVIGGRSFNQMPRKSRFGNRFISFVVRCFYSKSPIDTQSGMRAFKRSFLDRLMQVLQGKFFEVELHCLLFALKEKNLIVEVPIPTIYFDKNRSTNFLPFIDSYRVLKALTHHLLGLK